MMGKSNVQYLSGALEPVNNVTALCNCYKHRINVLAVELFFQTNPDISLLTMIIIVTVLYVVSC